MPMSPRWISEFEGVILMHESEHEASKSSNMFGQNGSGLSSCQVQPGAKTF